MRTCPPCDSDCNQGRDCPIKYRPDWYIVILFLVLGVALGWFVGKQVGKAKGKEIGAKAALSTKPVSEALEMVCAGLWVGEQNKKYWEKENAK